jgi:hypothetical protein
LDRLGVRLHARSEDEDLEPLRSTFEASGDARADSNRVERLEVDEAVIELDASDPARTT